MVYDSQEIRHGSKMQNSLFLSAIFDFPFDFISHSVKAGIENNGMKKPCMIKFNSLFKFLHRFQNCNHNIKTYGSLRKMFRKQKNYGAFTGVSITWYFNYFQTFLPWATMLSPNLLLLTRSENVKSKMTCHS